MSLKPPLESPLGSFDFGQLFKKIAQQTAQKSCRWSFRNKLCALGVRGGEKLENNFSIISIEKWREKAEFRQLTMQRARGLKSFNEFVNPAKTFGN